MAYLGNLETGDGLYRDPPFPNSATFFDTTRTAALLGHAGLDTDFEAMAAWIGNYQNASGMFSDSLHR